MKLFLSTVILFIVIISQCFAQWAHQNSGTSKMLLSVHFLNENLGWAAGHDGTILKTTNGGDTWTPQSIGTLDDIHSIFFKDSLLGWAALYEFIPDRHGSIIHTTDGGDSWNIQLDVNGYTFHSLHFYDEKNGWVVGSSGIAFHTTNGGNTWLQQYPNTQGGWLWPIFFIDNNIGWTTGDPLFGMFKSTNGGLIWTSTNLTVVERVYSIVFVDPQIGWLSAAHGQIAKSIDGGITWENVQSGTTQYLRDIYFFNYNFGWSVGYNGTIIYSIDGGNSWEDQFSGTSSNLYSVQFINDHVGWSVGDNGVILKFSSYLKLINILAPNGGEIITAGSTYFIEWNSQDVIDVKIEYSTDNGINWISVTDSIPSTGIYDWTVPDTFTTEGRVKISDLTDPNIFDISDQSFTIQSSKVITVISPNGGEILDGGSQYEILWSSEEVEYVKLEYSINNGASWNSITDTTESTGVYSWTVPNVLTTQARIKISDISLPSIYDASDEPFRINYVVSVDENVMVTVYKLHQNFPNPFNPTTTIKYQIPELSFVTIKIYDVLGNEIASLINEEKPAGYFEVEFNASALSSGIYYYKLVAGNFIDVKKMILLK